jgi:hypothetical protein
MINQQFSKWTVLALVGSSKHGKLVYRCMCDCGSIHNVGGSDLRTGGSTQCRSCSAKITGRKGLDAQVKPNLYLVSCGEYIKIGSTDNVIKRLNNMKVGNPYPLILEYHGIGLGHLEPVLHTLYAEFHHQGEWFLRYPRDILTSPEFINLITSE